MRPREPHEDRLHLEFDPDASDQTLVQSLLSKAGQFGHVATISGKQWYPLDTRLDVDPSRTHGTGSNLLHVDYLAHESPPRYIGLVCLRPDPGGGGRTILARFRDAVATLGADERASLREQVFNYFYDPTGAMFGPALNRFGILPSSNDEFVRFTEKMLVGDRFNPKLEVSDVTDRHRGALRRLTLALNKNTDEFLLTRGQAVLFDQRLWAHGRQALAPNQHALSPDTRRLLIQCYVH